MAKLPLSETTRGKKSENEHPPLRGVLQKAVNKKNVDLFKKNATNID